MHYKTENEWQEELEFNYRCIRECELERMTIPIAKLRRIDKKNTEKSLVAARKKIDYELNREFIRNYQNTRYAKLKKK